MPLFLNSILTQEDVPIPEVRLLRHRDQRKGTVQSPYQLWRSDRPGFELYQSHQSLANRSNPRGNYWVSFVGTPEGSTLFVGLYVAEYLGPLEQDTVMPHTGTVEAAGTCDVYGLMRDSRLAEFEGRLLIDWGTGTRRWIQRADNQNKHVVEIKQSDVEPEFPGFSSFVERLSRIANLPLRWADALRATRGIYLLVCPRTKEQYVGSATGKDGFLGRWLEYAQSGYEGNVVLKSRDPSDYQVSVLEVVGNTVSDDEVRELETRWKTKLMSREMGLNRN